MSTQAPLLDLRSLADLYESALKVRNACENRLRAVAQGADDAPGSPPVANNPLLDRLNDALDQARLDMEGELGHHPIYEWLMGIPGINRTMGCRVLGLIPMDGSEDFPSFSKLRVFAGICPGRNRLVKGEKACFSRRLKTALFVAFSSMLKAAAVCEGKPNAPKELYPTIYRKWRATYLARYGAGAVKKKTADQTDGDDNRFTHPFAEAIEWPDLRQHYAAKNKLLDVFLCHVWRKWREAKGWDVRSLYVHEKLGHHMDYNADDFSSAAMAKKKMKAHG